MYDRLTASSDKCSLSDLEGVVHRHRGMLFGFALNLTRDPHTAADVCQQTWLKLLEIQRRGQCPALEGAATQAYLLKIARNVYIDEYVRSHAVSRVDCKDHCELERNVGSGDDSAGVEHIVEKVQLHGHLAAALATLPPLQTQVLSLWASGVTPAALARRASVPRDTILSRKKYGVAKLRRTLLARGLTADLATAG
jgi:RNA polymerase sigma-70 factor (ECF subfamily)